MTARDWLLRFFNLAVHVIPSAMLMHEAAVFLKPVRFAIDSTGRDKLDPVSRAVQYLQPDPLR